MIKYSGFKFRAALLTLAFALTFVGCSSDDAATTATSTATSYKGAGSA